MELCPPEIRPQGPRLVFSKANARRCKEGISGAVRCVWKSDVISDIHNQFTCSNVISETFLRSHFKSISASAWMLDRVGPEVAMSQCNYKNKFMKHGTVYLSFPVYRSPEQSLVVGPTDLAVDPKIASCKNQWLRSVDCSSLLRSSEHTLQQTMRCAHKLPSLQSILTSTWKLRLELIESLHQEEEYICNRLIMYYMGDYVPSSYNIINIGSSSAFVFLTDCQLHQPCKGLLWLLQQGWTCCKAQNI